MLADRDARRGRVEQADRLVRQLAAPGCSDATAAPPPRSPRRGSAPDGASPAARRCRASSGSPCPPPAPRPAPPGSGGSAPGPSRSASCIRPRSSPRSCAACRAPAPASAGWPHRPVPAAPPAPISVCASSMNRMIGLRRGLHLLDDLAQPVLELALHAGAGLQQADIEHAHADVAAAAAARRPERCACAKPSTTAVLPTPASPVRIGLFCRRRISTSIDLADLGVAADDRIDLAACAPARSGRSRTVAAPPACPSPPAPSRRRLARRATRDRDRRQRRLRRARQDGGEILAQRLGLDPLELPADRDSALRSVGVFSAPSTQMPGAHLRLAEHQRARTPSRARPLPRPAATRSEIAVAPRGSRSSAAVTSRRQPRRVEFEMPHDAVQVGILRAAGSGAASAPARHTDCRAACRTRSHLRSRGRPRD